MSLHFILNEVEKPPVFDTPVFLVLKACLLLKKENPTRIKVIKSLSAWSRIFLETPFDAVVRPNGQKQKPEILS